MPSIGECFSRILAARRADCGTNGRSFKNLCAACQKALFANYEETRGYELAEQLDWELPDVILYQTDRAFRPDRNVEGVRRKWRSSRLAVEVSHFSAFRLPTNDEFGILERFSEDESTTNLYRRRHRRCETILNQWVLARVRVSFLFSVRKHPGSARRPPRPRS